MEAFLQKRTALGSLSSNDENVRSNNFSKNNKAAITIPKLKSTKSNDKPYLDCEKSSKAFSIVSELVDIVKSCVTEQSIRKRSLDLLADLSSTVLPDEVGVEILKAIEAISQGTSSVLSVVEDDEPVADDNDTINQSVMSCLSIDTSGLDIDEEITIKPKTSCTLPKVASHPEVMVKSSSICDVEVMGTVHDLVAVSEKDMNYAMYRSDTGRFNGSNPMHILGPPVGNMSICAIKEESIPDKILQDSPSNQSKSLKRSLRNMAASKRPVSLNSNSRRKKAATKPVSNPPPLLEVDSDNLTDRCVQETEPAPMVSIPDVEPILSDATVNVELAFESQSEVKHDASVSVGSKRRSRRASISSTPQVIPSVLVDSFSETEELFMSSCFSLELIEEKVGSDLPAISVPPRKKSRRASVSGAVNAAMLRDSLPQRDLAASDVLFNGVNIKTMSRDNLREALKSLVMPCPSIKEDMILALTDALVEKQDMMSSMQTLGSDAKKSDDRDVEESIVTTVDKIRDDFAEVIRSGRRKRTAAFKSGKSVSIVKTKSYEPIMARSYYTPCLPVDDTLANCFTGLTHSERYITSACTIIETSPSFQNLVHEKGVKTLVQLVAAAGLEQKLSGHVLIFFLSVLTIVCESHPVLRVNGGLVPFSNMFVDMLIEVYKIEMSVCDDPLPFTRLQSEKTNMKKSVSFSSHVCGGSVSPTNERKVASWRHLESSASRLHALLSGVLSTFRTNGESTQCTEIFEAAFLEMYLNKITTEKVSSAVLSFIGSSVDVKDIKEVIDLVVPDLSFAIKPPSDIEVPQTILRERLSWILACGVRARFRWLLDDNYPTISAGCRYTYDGCRSGLFELITVNGASSSILDLTSENESTSIISTTEVSVEVLRTGFIDVATLPLSTLLTQALRQLSVVAATENPDELEFLWASKQEHIILKTELAQTVVAAEAARRFLRDLLSISLVQEKQNTWTPIERLARMLAVCYCSEEKHILLCANMQKLLDTIARPLQSYSKILPECCGYLLALESAGLSHPLAIPSKSRMLLENKNKRNRSNVLDYLADDMFDELNDLVKTCELIFDFPIVQEKQMLHK